MKTLIVIGGPTASGKTNLAIDVANFFQTEILSVDSRQCFKEMNIGVAKPSEEQLNSIKHHFINSHSIFEKMSAGIYEQYATKKLNDIFSKKEIAVCVGGTGLYIKALCEGIDEMPDVNPEIEQEVNLNYEKYGLAYLQDEIKKQDNLFYQTGEIQNPHRLIRALVFKLSIGVSILEYRKNKIKKRDFDIDYFAIDIDRTKLYQHINLRVDFMIQEGLVAEAQSLYPYKHLKPLQTIGYQELFDFFENKISLQQSIDKIKQHTRNYAKRQSAWFRHQADFHFIEPNYQNIIKKLKL